MRTPDMTDPLSSVNDACGCLKRRKAREDIVAGLILPGANAWQQGNVYQIKGA